MKKNLSLKESFNRKHRSSGEDLSAHTVALYAHIDSIINRKTTGKSKKKLLRALLLHLKSYHPKDIPLSKVNRIFVTGFLLYIKQAEVKYGTQHKALNSNTQYCYFKLLRYVLNDAEREDRIAENPCVKITSEEKPRRKYTERPYLTVEELRLLADNMPIHNALLNHAFLFCCFSGLRHCDMSALTWRCVEHRADGSVWLHFEQRKTHMPLSVPLCKEAVKHMPDSARNGEQCTVFNGLYSLGHCNHMLQRWMQAAGIRKHITFHCARHTYATLLLNFGADLYTVSKLLGHTRIQTTQIYARIIDETKKKAVDLLPELL